MKLSKIFSISLVILAVYITSFSMPFAKVQGGMDDGNAIEEKRPFDFTNEYYETNGVYARLIVNRRTGTDGDSVVDFIDSKNHRNVRVISTLPAYNGDGKLIYWASFGELFKDAFIEGRGGEEAYNTAHRYPIYTFPSTTHKKSDRQAAVIETGNGYFENNSLGLGVVVLVEYTKKAQSKEGQEVLAKFVERNGITLDGTPIIHTTDEIADLTRRGLVSQKIRGIDDESQTPFIIAKVFQSPTQGAISPDAFLEMVLKDNGKPLDAERTFVDNFDCLQRTGGWCSGKK